LIHIVLFQPEIPPNTGNIIRLCANTGAMLHLIHPLGFEIEDKQLKRAGLDYHEWARLSHHNDYDAFLREVNPRRIWALSTRGQRLYTEIHYEANDALLFGPETRGLPSSLLMTLPESTLRIPMFSNSRSLNLSNAVAIVAYEAMRQIGFHVLSLK
jgi:tRNA (cytidine/uridine-2'-O-)-methyltransferase